MVQSFACWNEQSCVKYFYIVLYIEWVWGVLRKRTVYSYFWLCTINFCLYQGWKYCNKITNWSIGTYSIDEKKQVPIHENIVNNCILFNFECLRHFLSFVDINVWFFLPLPRSNLLVYLLSYQLRNLKFILFTYMKSTSKTSPFVKSLSRLCDTRKFERFWNCFSKCNKL